MRDTDRSSRMFEETAINRYYKHDNESRWKRVPRVLGVL